MSAQAPFRLEVLVDFLDDALTAGRPLTERDLDGMMRLLAAAGVQRVNWAYYADGRGGFQLPAGLDDGTSNWENCQTTYRALGNPLRAAVEAGHRHGLEVYAYYKPYETGTSLLLTDPVGTAMIKACQFAGVPVSHNHHVFADEDWYLEEARRVAGDGRFAGLILYELDGFHRSDYGGNSRFTLPVVESICRELGKHGGLFLP